MFNDAKLSKIFFKFKTAEDYTSQPLASFDFPNQVLCHFAWKYNLTVEAGMDNLISMLEDLALILSI